MERTEKVCTHWGGTVAFANFAGQKKVKPKKEPKNRSSSPKTLVKEGGSVFYHSTYCPESRSGGRLDLDASPPEYAKKLGVKF